MSPQRGGDHITSGECQMSYFRSIFFIVLLMNVFSGPALACDQDAICRHILWCLTDSTIDPNDVSNLNWSIDHDSGTDVRFNTEKCQKSRSHHYGDWHGEEPQCDNGAMIGMAKLARANKCATNSSSPTPVPVPQPVPFPGTHPNNKMNWCETPSGKSCATVLPVGSSCFCNVEPGRSHK
jgi:hypothetical protein